MKYLVLESYEKYLITETGENFHSLKRVKDTVLKDIWYDMGISQDSNKLLYYRSRSTETTKIYLKENPALMKWRRRDFVS